MTESAPEIEKAPEKGRKMANPSATFFTYAGWGVAGVIAGYAAAYADAWTRRPGVWVLFAIVIVSAAPALIGLIVKLLSDKQMPWYKTQAAIAGLVVGFFWGFI